MKRLLAPIVGLVILPLATFAYAAVTAGRVTGAAIFLGFATGVLAWVLWLIFRAARAMVTEPEAAEKARATGRRRKDLEREKQMLLKALKELEFDYKMGKISDADFKEISGQFRSRTARVLKLLDQTGSATDYRDLMERDVERRKRERGGAASGGAASGGAASEREAKSGECAKCQTRNDDDATFCKKCGSKLGAAVALLAVILFTSFAVAQPMMVDPSKMSGIPRPDAQVPAGTITVRLIRGELSNRITAQEVELRDTANGQTRKAKTNDEGRATFGGLSGGPFLARAVVGDEEQVSQPMTLPREVGVRVMLVFSAGGLGSPDGVAHLDKSVPAHTVLARVVGDGGAPLAGLEVVLGMARQGEEGVVERKAVTDAKGEARWEGLDTKPTSAYVVEAIRDGARHASKPFRLTDAGGVRVVIEVRAVSHDVKSLAIAAGSHLILELGDDAVQVAEVLRLENSATSAVEVPGGLHLPLPSNAQAAAPGQNPPGGFTVQAHEAVWKGPIPAGTTELQILFVLPYKGDRLEIAQPLALSMGEFAAVTEKIDGMQVEGLSSEERTFGGKRLVVYRGPATPAGGELQLTMTGLPHSDPTPRILAALAALAIALGFAIYAARAGGSGRAALETHREHLLEELAALDAKAPLDAKRQKKRDELAEKLVDVYRQLDQTV